MTVAESGLPAEGAAPEAAAAPKRKSTTFAGDVLKLVSGTTLAQGLTILVTPILTRLFHPEAFGSLALFTSITGIIGVVACLRYELAIMLPDSDDEAANLLALSLVFVVVVSVLTVPLIILVREPLLVSLKAPQLGPYLWLVPVATLFSGTFLACNFWNSRTKHFMRLSAARVFSATATSGARIGAGVAGYNTGGSLIGAAVLGSVLSSLSLGIQIWRDDRRLLKSTIRWSKMYDALRRYSKFPIYSTWSALLNTVSWQLPPFLLSYFFTQTDVGYYDLSNRVLHLPMSLIGGAIAQVFFQRAAEARAHDQLGDVVMSAYRRLVTFGLFPFMVLAIVGKDVFSVVLGPQWAVAGSYTQILSVWTFFWFISSPLTHVFSVLERPDISLRLNVVIFATRFASLAVGGLLHDVRLSLMLFSLSGVIVYGYVNALALTKAGASAVLGLTVLFRQFLVFSPFLAFIGAVKAFGATPIVVTIMSVPVLVLYLAYVAWRDPQVRLLIVRSGSGTLQRFAGRGRGTSEKE